MHWTVMSNLAYQALRCHPLCNSPELNLQDKTADLLNLNIVSTIILFTHTCMQNLENGIKLIVLAISQIPLMKHDACKNQVLKSACHLLHSVSTQTSDYTFFTASNTHTHSYSSHPFLCPLDLVSLHWLQVTSSSLLHNSIRTY